MNRAKKVLAFAPFVFLPIVVAGAMAYDSYSRHRRRIKDGWRWE